MKNHLPEVKGKRGRPRKVKETASNVLIGQDVKYLTKKQDNPSFASKIKLGIIRLVNRFNATKRCTR